MKFKIRQKKVNVKEIKAQFGGEGHLGALGYWKCPVF